MHANAMYSAEYRRLRRPPPFIRCKMLQIRNHFMQLFHDSPAYSAACIETFHILFQPFLTGAVINFIPVGIGNHPYQRRQVYPVQKAGSYCLHSASSHSRPPDTAGYRPFLLLPGRLRSEFSEPPCRRSPFFPETTMSDWIRKLYPFLFRLHSDYLHDIALVGPSPIKLCSLASFTTNFSTVSSRVICKNSSISNSSRFIF